MNVHVKREYTEKQLHILEVAAEEFLQLGYVAASTNTIAKKAAVAKGLIFHYFKNKEGLYNEVLAYALSIVSIKIESKTLSLSTFMDAFELLSELITIKEVIIYDEPLYAPLLLQAFAITTEIPDTLITYIKTIEAGYYRPFTTFLDGVFIHEQLRAPFKRDAALARKLMMLLEASFAYEKAQLPEINEKTIRGISLDSYILLLKKGLLL